jgi:hypothetical protein
MSNIKSVDITLQEIVKNIFGNSYLIPKFQRDFVWTTKDITDLGDSIIRGYPISSLLTMQENGTLKVGSHSLLKDEFNNNINNNLSRYYILDGQQRMTSISKIFISADNKNEYYFDLLSMLIEKFPHDHIKNDTGIKKHCCISPISNSFCRSFPITKDRSEKPTRQNHRFISGKHIINNKFGSVINMFLTIFEESSKDDFYKYMDYLNAILGSVSGYSLLVMDIASDSELGVVIRVFEKVNSTGRKLTLFDLINAKSFQVNNSLYKGGLSDYLTNRIKINVKNNKKLESGVNKFLGYDKSKEGFEKLDRIVRIFEITSLLKKEISPNIFQSVMLMKEPVFWFESWVDNGDQMLEIMSWMKDEGLMDIGQVTFLEYAMSIFLANPKSFKIKKFKVEIKKYALFLALSNTGFNKSDIYTVEKLYLISKKITNDHESTKYIYDSPSRRIDITTNQILEFTTSKQAFKAIINIFYIDKVDGFFTMDIVGNSIKNIYKSDMDKHHIFPKTRVKNYSVKSKFNSIANIILVDNTANREDIKDKTPKEYFSLMKNSDSKSSLYCEHNLINLNDVINITTEEEADVFIKIRAKRIAKIINLYFE